MTTPHVFITRGDLTTLVCDAWLLPSDGGFHITPGFAATAPDEVSRDDVPEGWDDETTRAFAVPGTDPVCVVTKVGSHGREATWYADGARNFVAAAAAALAGTAPSTKRPLPLLAMPFVGTGYGGARRISGDVALALVEAVAEQATRSGVDVVIVAWTDVAHAALQRARADLVARQPGSAAGWSDLGALEATAASLGEKASAGRLVLFLGAGVSAGSALPDWKALIARLAADAGLSPEETAAIGKLDLLDQARIVERRLGDPDRLHREVGRHLAADRYPLVQGLAASLPVGEVVTTNYDRLFEMACAGAHQPTAVLPWEPATTGRWLLKMHGCVDKGGIVLTRHDYHRYHDTRAALAGIVQAMLITRHMLFLGFSLTDANFHRIVDDVRQAVRGGEATEALGTALVLHDNPAMRELWEGDVDLVAMGGDDTATPARLIEVLLDRVNAIASDVTAHVLDDDYAGLLTAEERELKAALLRLRDFRDEKVTGLLRRFGG